MPEELNTLESLYETPSVMYMNEEPLYEELPQGYDQNTMKLIKPDHEDYENFVPENLIHIETNYQQLSGLNEESSYEIVECSVPYELMH